MNRLVIIGNGFDLAHGLPTSYKDFIDDIWRQIAIDESKFENLVFINRKYGFLVGKPIESYSQYIDSLKNYKLLTKNDYKDVNWDEEGFYVSKFGVSNKDYLLRYVNVFFKIICSKNSIYNWVDIENEYYILLKECLKENNSEDIIELNKQFFEVKNLLEKYLKEKVENTFEFSKADVKEFEEILETKKYDGEKLTNFFKEISKKDEQIIKKEFEKFEKKIYDANKRSGVFKKELKLETHFLSFNYTSTVSKYIEKLNLDSSFLNEIHGSLFFEDNPINFGFGDEMDKHYQEIEEKNDNEYLKNIKSFQYLHTSNYKRLLDLIESDKFQVYIMGHSCGLSDRTLLNTIFEHENCCSIKVFYHEIKDENGKVIKDNYTEITQYISRHFNKKSLMRSKIVNKTLCDPLPQIKLPLKYNGSHF